MYHCVSISVYNTNSKLSIKIRKDSCVGFKMEEGKNGENTIKINRDHKAYKMWTAPS